jgi:hypothetical protein
MALITPQTSGDLAGPVALPNKGALPVGLSTVGKLNPYVALVVFVVLVAGDVLTHVYTGAQSYATLASVVAIPGATAMLGIAAGAPAITWLLTLAMHNQAAIGRIETATNGALSSRLEAQTATIVDTVIARLNDQDTHAVAVAAALAKLAPASVAAAVSSAVAGGAPQVPVDVTVSGA